MTISAGVFKAKCLQLMDQVRLKHTEVIITKYGKPVAKLVPITDDWKPGKSASGWMRGTAITLGDIVGPLDVKWAANED